ncbi:MAG: hypothetical protein ABJC09_03430 [Terriglobia bacterium]
MISLMLAELREKSRWLSQHSSNVTSQFGEDGIIAKALSLLPERTGWCVEFGAWDGKLYSNTYDLVTSKDYRGVFIEADPIRFRDLERTHGTSGRNVLVNAFVGFTKSDSLDVILSRTDIPEAFDLLSIDIDGNDYHVWQAMEHYRPNLVVIEFNPTISNSVLFVQKRHPAVSQGSSPRSLVELAKSKGYELICATANNLLFVASEHYGAFNIPDNSLELMRDDSNVGQIFIGYDGHVFLSQGGVHGQVTVAWHGVKLAERKVQVLPKALQKYPDQYTLIQRVMFYALTGPGRVWRKLSKRRGVA